MSQKKQPKAIALMSGGLDSALAARIVKDQGVEVIGLHLLSPFGCREEVEKTALSVGVPLIFKDKGEAYLDLVENPRYGYGRNMNPCIDCRIFMFQLADVVMREQGADFVVTGEVIGQRPMSQAGHSMDLIDSKSPLDGLVLRPLCAKQLEPTVPEKEGWVNRDTLFDISGRSRKAQLALVEQLGITGFSSPGGGCLLTESLFSNRLKDFFKHPAYQSSEERLAQSALLRLGRHFRFSQTTKIIVGRNQQENEEMEKLWPNSGGELHFPVSFDGPSAIVIGESGEEIRRMVGEIITRYGKSAGLDDKRIRYRATGNEGELSILQPIAEEQLERMRL